MRLARALHEPLVHFLAAGTLLFAVYAWRNTAEDQSAVPKMHISEGDVQSLRETWRLQWQREPTTVELGGAVMQLLNERLLAAEAHDMRLDENDTIVRRRLAQKLDFIIEGTARIAEPTERDLQAFYESHQDEFREEGQVSFTHLYFSQARHTDAEADARAVLAELSARGSSEPNDPAGDSFLLGADFQDQSEQMVLNAFGRGFARSVFALKLGSWSGPIKSSYGIHLVRVLTLTQPRLPPFAAVRSQVLEAWRSDQEKTTKNEYLARLRKKYDVVIDDQVKLLVGGM